ncbi:putative membrane protein [Paenibacillus shirakamiensis]|uniref:Membrane protein n=1 Tax=Paenibacillus shirakamiensis TaxID=1265935 RepID=A0ABS4JK15_9BACL|nr:hypothetical protein [Paenibacillus shirakamiensis]MBP2002056.1 putative membrane protein [Paenibacillus shirakamiensis]
MDVQVWMDFFKQNWLLFVVALVVLLLIANLVKTMVKWGLILVIVAFLVIYSGISLKDLGQVASTLTQETTSAVKNEAIKMMQSEAKDAKLTTNQDGSFVITSPNLKVSGHANEDKVKVEFRGVSLGQWSRSDALNVFIQQAKQNY